MLSADSASELHHLPYHHPTRFLPRALPTPPSLPPLSHPRTILHPHTQKVPPPPPPPQLTLSFLKTLSTSHTPAPLPHPRTSFPSPSPSSSLCARTKRTSDHGGEEGGGWGGDPAAELECMRADKKLKLIFFN